MYVEYLREKWFLVLISIGGGLGSIAWLSIGILLNLNYLIDFWLSTFKIALNTLINLVQQCLGGDIFAILKSSMDIDSAKINFNMDNIYHPDFQREGIFIQEINYNLAFDTMHFMMNSSIYLYECIIFSRILSDMICGWSSKLDIINFFISFVGSSFSYGLLFFTFSSFDSRILVYDMISVFLLSLNFLIEFLTIAKWQYKKFFKNWNISKNKHEQETEIDIQSKILLD